MSKELLGFPVPESDPSEELLASMVLGFVSSIAAVLKRYDELGLKTVEGDTFQEMFRTALPLAQKIAHKRGWEKFASIVDEARARFPE